MTARKPVQSPRKENGFIDHHGRLTNPAFDLLQDIVNGLNGSKDGLYLSTVIMGVRITVGAGSPAGAVTGSVPDLYLRTDGGAATCLYVKESGVETTGGWVGK